VVGSDGLDEKYHRRRAIRAQALRQQLQRHRAAPHHVYILPVTKRRDKVLSLC
jgi:hypothetical protein